MVLLNICVQGTMFIVARVDDDARFAFLTDDIGIAFLAAMVQFCDQSHKMGKKIRPKPYFASL